MQLYYLLKHIIKKSVILNFILFSLRLYSTFINKDCWKSIKKLIENNNFETYLYNFVMGNTSAINYILLIIFFHIDTSSNQVNNSCL